MRFRSLGAYFRSIVVACVGQLFLFVSALAASTPTDDPKKTFLGVDMSLDGLRAYSYSLYIFGFLILSLIFFSYIIYLYAPKGGEKFKTGEKIMFGSIAFGVVIAVIIGYVQLIEGYLF